MNAWAVLAIAIAAVIVVVWAIAELERWLHGRRREAGLRQVYDEALAEVDVDAGVDRLRDRRPW